MWGWECSSALKSNNGKYFSFTGATLVLGDELVCRTDPAGAGDYLDIGVALTNAPRHLCEDPFIEGVIKLFARLITDLNGGA